MPAPAPSQVRPTTVDVDLPALLRNFRRIQAEVGEEVTLLAAVKGDAYGHGAVPVARALEAAGCPWFGVALVEEGRDLRRAGISAPILLLSGVLPEGAQSVVDNALTPVLYDLETAAALDDAGRRAGLKVPVHLKVDTGMGRLGSPRNRWEDFLDAVGGMPWLHVEGVMTHFASAETDAAFTELQHRRFQDALAAARARGFAPRHVHLANSAGLVSRPAARGSMVRPGVLLYGVGPDQRMAASLGLEPVMSVRSRVLFVQQVPRGESVSYGRTWIADRPSKIAVVPVGYADGYPRLLSNRADVLIGGQRAPVRGRVCMDLTMVDVTDHAGPVRPGDEVVLLGSQGGERITVEELAERAQTIPYEILCNFSARVPRRHGGGGAP